MYRNTKNSLVFQSYNYEIEWLKINTIIQNKSSFEAAPIAMSLFFHILTVV